MDSLLERFGKLLARYLEKPHRPPAPEVATPLPLLCASLQPADVLLVEGNMRISTAIKYLTQSTWSHAALYIGAHGETEHSLLEADVQEGVRTLPVDHYAGMHTRICRPLGLNGEERRAVITYGLDRLGHQYDLRNVFDLVRYLLPTPPVPSRYRRRMIALGSGDPTRAICSTLIAQAFQSIQYPILPQLEYRAANGGGTEELYHIRHHSLFTPRDFDVSPYFAIVKPLVEEGFDFRRMRWANH